MGMSWRGIVGALAVGCALTITCSVIEADDLPVDDDHIALCSDPGLVCKGRGGTPRTCTAGADPCVALSTFMCTCDDSPVDMTACYCKASP